MSIAMSTRLNNFGLYFNKAYHFSIEIAFTFCRIIKSDLHERFEIGVNSFMFCHRSPFCGPVRNDVVSSSSEASRPVSKNDVSNPAGFCQQVICLRLLYF